MLDLIKKIPVIGKRSHNSKAAADRASAAGSSAFPLFSALPAELRDQIWYYALPHRAGSALCVYREGCWRDDRVPSDKDVLPGSRMAIPMAFVNREAWIITRSWMRDLGIRYDSAKAAFVVPFNLAQDALYVSSDMYASFDYDGHMFDRSERALDRTGCTEKCSFTRLAISMHTLSNQWRRLMLVGPNYHGVKVLLIVVNSPNGEQFATQQWEFEDLEGGLFDYDQNSGRFETRKGHKDGYEFQFRLIERALNRRYSRNRRWATWFQVRAVKAVRRWKATAATSRQS